MSSCNVATEFVAAVIALALFIIVSSVSKPLEKIPDVSANKLFKWLE